MHITDHRNTAGNGIPTIEAEALREQLRIANQTADALAEANGEKIDEINRLNRQIVALQRENRTLNNQVQRAQIQLIQLDDLITDLTAALKAKIDEIIGG